MRNIKITLFPKISAGICILLMGLAPAIGQTNADENTVTAQDDRNVTTQKNQQDEPHLPRASTNEPRRIHVFISGKVQGVGFRVFTKYSADPLKITGWVMNLRDGRVELVAEGSTANLEKLLKAVAKGPSGARVDKIEQKEETYTGEFKSFEIER
jgi:acylphosphatase